MGGHTPKGTNLFNVNRVMLASFYISDGRKQRNRSDSIKRINNRSGSDLKSVDIFIYRFQSLKENVSVTTDVLSTTTSTGFVGQN